MRDRDSATHRGTRADERSRRVLASRVEGPGRPGCRAAGRLSPAARWIELAEEHGIYEMPTWRNEWIYFLPNQVVVLEPYGVTRREFVYNAPIIAALIDTDGAAPSGKVRIFWDPNDLRQVYCFDVAGNAYEVPWVFRTQETPVFTDFRVDVALKRVDGSTVSKSQYRQRVADLVVGWRAEDEVVLVRVRGRRSEEEMLASQLDKIRAVDPGTVISADEFVGQAAVESMRARDDALDIDEDEGIRRLDNVEDDLFDEFDS